MVTYIGNRCIMTPEGIWSSTKSYEALSLVSHQTTGDGYVSRRAVPTGVDISDDTYWVKMTDFNVQLAAAQAAAEKAEEDAAAALAGVEGKVDATKIITSKEALLALLETGYIADATLVRQLYNELNGKTPGAGLADFDGSDPEDAALLMYKYGDDNWAGIGASPSGNVRLSLGVNTRYEYEFSPIGIYLDGKRVSDPGIVKIPASQTILATFIAQADGAAQRYTYGISGVPSDYPQALKDAGVSFCPVMTILKASAAVGMILIQDAQNSSGAPHAIFGYTTTTRTFWGDVL